MGLVEKKSLKRWVGSTQEHGYTHTGKNKPNY